MTKTAEQRWEDLLRECNRRTVQSAEAKREAKRALAVRRSRPAPEWIASEIRVNKVTQECITCNTTIGQYESGPYLVWREGAHERLSSDKPSHLQFETLVFRVKHIIEERQTCITCMMRARSREASPSSVEAE